MKTVKTLFTTALLAATGVAQAELSANIGAVSNYYWRGVSQTGDSAAVQGGIDYAHDSGFYAGTWLSNIDFGDDSKADAEVDLYAGFGNDIGDTGFSYDIGAIYYWYPGAGGNDQGGDLDFAEVSLGLGFGPVSASVAYTVWGENDDNGPFQDGDIYYNLSADLPWEVEGFTSSVFVGHYSFDDDGKNSVGDLDYTHWGIGVSKDAGDFGSFSLNYEQTNKDDTVSTDKNPNFWVGWAKDF